MRLLSLSMVQWGALALPPLVLRSTGRLQVVVGPNEAGKTTTLRALRGLVRGLADEDAAPLPLRGAVVRAAVADGAGRVAEVERRGSDGARGALRDPGGLGVAAAWSGVSREAYDAVWCIDHDTLRRGGRALQRSDSGELGAVLLRSLVDGERLDAVSKAVNERVEALFNPAPNARKQVLNAAVARLREASDALRIEAVDPAEFTRRLDAERAAAAALRDAEAAAGAAEAAVLEATRLCARAPVVAQLDRLGAELDAVHALGPVPALAEAEAARDARSALAQAQEARAQAESARVEAERAHADIWVDAAAAGLVACWNDANRALGAYTRAEDARAAAAERAAAAQRDWAAASDALGAPLPEAARVDPLRSLASRLFDAEGAEQRAVEDAAAAEQRVAAAERRTRQAPPAPPPDDALDAAAGRLERARGPWESALAAAERRGVEAQRLAAEAQRLGLATVEAAAGVAVPGDAERRHWAARQKAADDEHTRAQHAVEDARHRAEDARRALDTVPPLPGVPDDAELARVREARDLALVDAFAGSGPGQPAVHALVARADALADARFRAADHLGRRAQLHSARLREHEALGLARDRLRLAEEGCAAVDAAWAAQRAAWGLPEVHLAGLSDWARAVESLREAAARHAQDLAQDAIATREAREALEALCAALGRPAVALTAAAVLDALAAAKRVRGERAALRQERHALDEELARARREAESAAVLRARAAALVARAREAWAQAVAPLGGPVTGDWAGADAWLERIERARAALLARDAAAAALAQIDADRRDFDQRTAPLCALLDHDPGPAHRVARTQERVEAAIRNGLRRDQAAQSLRAAEARATKAAADETRAADALRAALAAAGLGPIDALDAALSRAREADRLRAMLASQRDALGGADLAQLRAAIAGRDDAALAAAQQAAREDRDRAVLASEDARRLHREAVAAREAVDGREAAATAAAQAAQHAATAAQAAEELVRERAVRWMLAELQKSLAEAAQDGPVRRAGEVFARFTGGSFAGLQVLDDTVEGRQVRYLVGVRPNGEALVPSAMSDGTRDALWLALRVAVIEAELDRGVCLPVVLDDVAVHLSDERTDEVLKVFDTLAARTQVLLFTHHAAVAEQAATVAPGCEIIRLAPRSAAAPPVQLLTPPPDPLDGAAPKAGRAAPARAAGAPRAGARSEPGSPADVGLPDAILRALDEAREAGLNRGEILQQGLAAEAEWEALRKLLEADPRVAMAGRAKGRRYYAAGSAPAADAPPATE